MRSYQTWFLWRETCLIQCQHESYPTKGLHDQESSKRPWILTHQSKVRIIRLGTGWFFHCRGIFVERMFQSSSKVHTIFRRKNTKHWNFSPGTNIPSLPALISLVCAAIALGLRQGLYWKLCLSLQCPFPCRIKPVVCQAFVEPAKLEFQFSLVHSLFRSHCKNSDIPWPSVCPPEARSGVPNPTFQTKFKQDMKALASQHFPISSVRAENSKLHVASGLKNLTLVKVYNQ